MVSACQLAMADQLLLNVAQGGPNLGRLAKLGHIRRNPAQIWSTLGHSCQLVIWPHFGPSFGGLWRALAGFGRLWPNLARFRPPPAQLTTLGRCQRQFSRSLPTSARLSHRWPGFAGRASDFVGQTRGKLGPQLSHLLRNWPHFADFGPDVSPPLVTFCQDCSFRRIGLPCILCLGCC